MKETLRDKRRRGGLALVAKRGREYMRDIGSKGGKSTVKRHGKAYMAQLGKRGAAALWERYNLTPVGASGWVLVDRQTGKVKATIRNIPHLGD